MQGEGAKGLQESLGHDAATPGPSLEAKKTDHNRSSWLLCMGSVWCTVRGEKSEPQQASSDTVFTEAAAMRQCSREDCWLDLVTEHHIEIGNIGLGRYSSYSK